MRPYKHAHAALAFAAASLLAGRAQATLCNDPSMVPNPVYAVGSTAIGPVVQKIAAYLAGQQPAITLVYGGTGSCSGVSSVINTALGLPSGNITTPAGKTNYFVYYDNTGTEQHCDLFQPEAGAGQSPDIGLSDVYATSCQSLSQTLSSLSVVEHLGPVQAMTFAVPNNSTAESISGTAAFFVYGFGAVNGTQNTVSPWTDVMSIYQRGATSGTQAMIAQAIGLSSTVWYGVTPAFSGQSGTQSMITALTNAATNMNGNAIGILGAADIDPVRRMGTSTIRTLAYKHSGQNCGYLPDSDATHYDKRNVRDGHYAIWGPLHVFTLPTSVAAAAQVVTYLTGFQQLGTTDVISAEAQAGLVPQCAMAVTRTGEMGDLGANTGNTAPCACYYEKSASIDGTTSCAKCNVSSDCTNGYSCQKYGPAPAQGYCEPPI
jgi:ABC-type phosphate transport system substrate-binding protein